MLLFTADRPLELRGTGSNQTIDQLEIFGSYPQLFLNLKVGDNKKLIGNNAAAFPVADLEQAIAATREGPVHVNWMFREPFTIESDSSEPQVCSTGFSRNAGDFRLKPVLRTPIELTGNVLIALGGCQPAEAQQALELSARLNCPMLSDITSGLRTGSFELPSEFDLPVPDTILHLGGRIVSKTWHQWTATLTDHDVDFIHLTPTGQTVNPNGLAVNKVQMPLADLQTRIVGSACRDSFTQSWNDAAKKRGQVLHEQLADASLLSEPAVAFHVSQHCPILNGLFIGNSMPIRDMDWFGVAPTTEPRFVAANRGASGIDGLLATAVGYAAGLQKPTTVLLGDLSTLHDLNSLALVAKSQWPLVVVIVNNGAGHIFDQLPIQRSEHFEQFFATPHACQFEHAAKMFGLDYLQINDMPQFVKSYSEACVSGRSIVLELPTDRDRNQQVRKQIREEIRKCNA